MVHRTTKPQRREVHKRMAEKRLSVSISEELLDRLYKLKQEQFYDKTWADMYRFVLESGAEVCLKKGRK